MKKVFVVFTLALLLLSNILLLYNTSPASALGESCDWARIIKDNAYLYTEEDSSKQKFMLEKTYYVQIKEEGEKMYRVDVMQNENDFPRISGWVKKTDVELCSVEPIAPYYPTIKLTVTSNSVKIMLSPSIYADYDITATNTDKLSYYGKLVNDRNWYYVYFDGWHGYVEASKVSDPNVPLHPTPLVKEETPPASTTPVDTEPTNNTPDKISPTSEILLIVFVVLLAVGLTLALFLPGNIKKKSVFEQDI